MKLGDPLKSWLTQIGFILLSLAAPVLVGSIVLFRSRFPPEVAARFSPDRLIITIAVVAIFWFFTVFLLLRRSQQWIVRLLFLHGQVLAIGMVLPLSYAGRWDEPPGILGLSIAGFYFLAPLTLHIHISFPVHLGNDRGRRLVMTLLYLFAFAATVTWGSGFLLLRQIADIVTICIFTASIIVLIYSYAFRANTDSRRRLRLIWVGTFLALVPTNAFFFVPGRYGLPLHMPVWLVGLLLILVPLSYLAAITRQSLFGIDRLLNRTLVYFLLSGGIFLVYLVPLMPLYRLLPGDWLVDAVVSAGITLVIGWNFTWLRTRVERLVDRFFYGGWYDYPGVVDTVSNALVRSLEREQVAEVLTGQVPKLMHLYPGELWVGDAAEARLDRPEQPSLTFPFTLQGGLKAGWWVAGRLDGEDFSADDRRILKTLALQAEIALNNVVLVEALRSQLNEIRASRETLALIQRQLLRSREDERSRLARDLHDGPIQTLVGLNLQLGMLLATRPDAPEGAGEAGSRSPVLQTLEDMRVEVRSLLSELRQVCAELRPPMLDMLGLGAAIRALVEDWSHQNAVEADLDIPADGSLQKLPDEVAVNFYRVAQEALTNIARHADARKVAVALEGDASCLSLRIQDDGCGFDAPEIFRRSTEGGHFGLVGLRERVDLIGGEWALSSAPGKGTTLRVVWPKTR